MLRRDLSKPDVATAREVARLDFKSRHMRDSMPERAYDAAQKERWASIRSAKLYHEGEGINRFSCKVPTIPRSH